MNGMFLSILIIANVNSGTIEVDHPGLKLSSPALFGKTSTETPTGMFLIQKAYSTKLKRNMLVFSKEEDGVYAIHATASVKGQSREGRLNTASPLDNKISNGCINIPQRTFDILWKLKEPLILQVY